MDSTFSVIRLNSLKFSFNIKKVKLVNRDCRINIILSTVLLLLRSCSVASECLIRFCVICFAYQLLTMQRLYFTFTYSPALMYEFLSALLVCIRMCIYTYIQKQADT